MILGKKILIIFIYFFLVFFFLNFSRDINNIFKIILLFMSLISVRKYYRSLIFWIASPIKAYLYNTRITWCYSVLTIYNWLCPGNKKTIHEWYFFYCTVLYWRMTSKIWIKLTNRMSLYKRYLFINGDV